jgi:hypothetical protein
MKNLVIGSVVLATTPLIGTLYGYFNLWILGFLIPLNSHLQVSLVEAISYIPMMMLGIKILFVKRNSQD